MAIVSGTKGTVTLSTGYAVNTINWSITVDAPTQETTSWDDYSSGVWRTRVPGVKSWTGSFTARWDAETDCLSALEQAVTAAFIIDDTGTGPVGIGGSCILTNVSGSADMENPAEITFTFDGTGALVADTSAAS